MRYWSARTVAGHFVTALVGGGTGCLAGCSASRTRRGSSRRPGDLTPCLGRVAGRGGPRPAGSVERARTAWHRRVADDPSGAGRIAAYTTRASAPAGRRSGSRSRRRQRATGCRRTASAPTAGGTGHSVWRSGLLPGEQQPAAMLDPVETRTVVAPWTTSLTVDTTEWDAGLLRPRAAHRHGLGDARPVRRVVAVGARHRRARRPGDDLAGLQRVGRLQPVRRPGR